MFMSNMSDKSKSKLGINKVSCLLIYFVTKTHNTYFLHYLPIENNVLLSFIQHFYNGTQGSVRIDLQLGPEFEKPWSRV